MLSSKVSHRYAALAILVLATSLLFFYTPTNGEFWWYESARNALSGAFVRDLILAMPFHDPVGWAEAYYAKYPALIILFYPPLLHVVLGLAYIPLGVSQLSAMIVVFAFYFALIVGIYFLARRFFGPLAAAGTAIAYCMSPEVSLWGRQVLLEIPMMALLVWSVWYGFRFMEKGRSTDLYLAAFLGICSLYTKQTGFFVVALLGVFFLGVRGKALLARRCFWITVGVGLLSLVPLAIIQIKFASFNAMNVAGLPGGVSGATLKGFFWYLVRLPDVLTWWVIAPAAAFVVCFVPRIWRGAISRESLFLVLWFVLGYAVFTVISIKQTRHGIPMYLPVVFAAAGFFRLPPLAKWREYLALAMGLAVFATTLLFHPQPYVSGYDKAADYIVKNAPPNAVVLFSGHKDGDFIFSIRAHAERNDITVLRADKLFLNINILPELGLNAKSLSTTKIANQLRDYGVSYVVSDEKSFADAAVIRHLDSLLRSDRFEQVSTIPIKGQPLVKVDRLVIYRNKAKLPAVPEKPDLNIKGIAKPRKR